MSKVFTITEGLENMGALKTGGQGSVYKARRYGPIVTAVKILPTPIHSESVDDKHFADFQNEVTKLKRITAQHNPNVVKILSSGITESGSFPFIEMEFIEGPDLEDLLHPPHEGIFTIKEVIKVADQLSHALAHCHRLGVWHGDIKSNNVKFNINTGNYVLLDFGLALMNDESRRTSLRQAGAIEFMAPEQSDGKMLPQTDVYSFGIILYELLTGAVPFPLGGRGEGARNTVRLQHMETVPPDILSVRREKLPENWSENKKEREAQVPLWLLQMVERCLQKDPQARFTDGDELHDYLVQHSTAERPGPKADAASLQLQIARLQTEKNQLQQALAQKESELTSLRVALTRKTQAAEREQAVPPAAKRKRSFTLPLLLLALALIAAASFFAYTQFRKSGRDGKADTESMAEIVEPPKPKPVIGQFKVVADRAYFHNEPDSVTRRGAYMVPSEDTINVLENRNGFVYAEFTNKRGQTSKGWLQLSDLLTLDEWAERNRPLSKIEINERLQQAKAFAEDGNKEAALEIYKLLAEKEVPEAMFEWANRALKGEHQKLDCNEAFELVEKSSERGYTPAKRTLGFLYLFGQNRQVLRMSGYNNCSFERNVLKGSKLLVEAVSEGDSTASEVLNEFEQTEGSDRDSL